MPKGKRKEAGSRGGKVVTITTYLDEALVDAIDVLAAKAGITRSQLVRNMVMAAYDDVKLLDAVGLFTLIVKMESARRIYLEGLKDGFSQLQPA